MAYRSDHGGVLLSSVRKVRLGRIKVCAGCVFFGRSGIYASLGEGMSINEEELKRANTLEANAIWEMVDRAANHKGNVNQQEAHYLACEVRAQAARIANLGLEADNLCLQSAGLSRQLTDAKLRIAELEAERDALTAKVAHLYKLSGLPFVSLGIVCEDRDRLKHSDRELRAENSALRKALADAQAALGNIAYEVDAEERQPAAHTAFVAISPILRIPEAAATVHGAPKP